MWYAYALQQGHIMRVRMLGSKGIKGSIGLNLGQIFKKFQLGSILMGMIPITFYFRGHLRS